MNQGFSSQSETFDSLSSVFSGFPTPSTYAAPEPYSAFDIAHGLATGLNAALTVASLAPGPVGAIASAAQAGLDLVQGHYIEAGIDTAGVALSFVGLGFAAKAIKLAREARLAKDVDSLAVDAEKIALPAQDELNKLFPRRTPWRAGVREQVFQGSRRAGGKVYDSYTGIEIKYNEPWQFGHEPGYKFSDWQKRAWTEKWSREDWNNFLNDPATYRAERRLSNEGHYGEDSYP